jgi:hypothetical protein
VLRRLIAITTCSALGVLAPAAAQAQAAEPARPSQVANEPSVQSVARALIQALPKLEGGVLVSVSGLQAQPSVERGNLLALRVATLAAGFGGFQAPEEVTPLKTAIARAKGKAWVLSLTVALEGGRLQVTADVHPVPKTRWARIRNPLPGSVAHAFADAPIDAEVRSFLPPVPLVSALTIERAKSFEREPLALLCEDLDRDGAPEIVVVGREQVSLVRLHERRVSPIASRAWKDLSLKDETPWREPMALVFATSPSARGGLPAPRELVVASTDRAKSVRLNAALESVTSYAGFALPDADRFSCATFDSDTLTGPLAACADTTGAPTRASVSGRFDAYAGTLLVGADGTAVSLWAGREDGRLEVRDGAGKLGTAASVGAQLAVGDLNQDGTPEILASLDVPRGSPDAVVVYSWEDRTKQSLKEMLRVPVAAGVRAIAVCPPIDRGRVPFVIASSDELMVAR